MYEQSQEALTCPHSEFTNKETADVWSQPQPRGPPPSPVLSPPLPCQATAQVFSTRPALPLSVIHVKLLYRLSSEERVLMFKKQISKYKPLLGERKKGVLTEAEAGAGGDSASFYRMTLKKSEQKRQG